MAKAKSTSKPVQAKVNVKPTESGSQTVTLDLVPFLMPVAVVFSTLILSATIFFTFRGTSLVAGSNTGSNGVTPTTTTTVPSAGGSTGTVNIDDDPIKGDKNAKVVIVEFTDYECPFCQSFHQQTYPKIIKDYVDTGKVAFVTRDFPLSFHNPQATTAALTANCVKELGGDGKFYEFKDKYFAATATNGQGPTGQTATDIAGEVGVDKSKVATCVSDKKYQAEIEKDTADGTAAGVNGTPNFIVGLKDSNGNVTGTLIGGAQDYSVFKTTIDEFLAK